jgi:hypothetical protein
VGVEELFHRSRVGQASLAGPAIEQHITHDGLPALSCPLAEGNREAHLLAREDFVRQQPANRFAQDALGREAAKLESIGQAGGEFDKHVIEKRHPAFNRRGHAHLVLLHQQLDEVRLDVGVEEPSEDAARPIDLCEIGE